MSALLKDSEAAPNMHTTVAAQQCGLGAVREAAVRLRQSGLFGDAQLAGRLDALSTAIAAKDAELAAVKENCETVCNSYADENQRLYDRAERAEAALAEARKAHSTILAVLGNVEHRGGGPNAARMYADMLNDIREIARRALTGGKVDG